MARRLPGADAVIVGLGWTGSVLARELTDAGLRMVAVERGPWRDTATDFPTTYAQDELRHRIRHDLEWFGCGNYSRSSPQTCILPALVRSGNFEARTECEVTRVNMDRTGKRATGVTFVDAAGEEWEQLADIVLLCAFQMFNVQLLLHSGIGKPCDPATGEGTVGRNYS